MTAGEAVTDRAAGADAHLQAVVHLYRQPEADVVALAGVDLHIDGGAMVALLGPSGSGKSTVLALLAGILRPTSGTVAVAGKELNRLSARQLLRLRATEVSLVLQDPASNLLGYGTAAENIAFAQTATRRRGSLGRAPTVLEMLDLAHLSARPVSTLSAGQRQQVALAAGIAIGPRLLLVDEPTSQLDVHDRQEVIDLLHTINDGGTTVVAVTHDPVVAASMPRTITIRGGRVGSEGGGGLDRAVVAGDGSIQLPPEALGRFPPGSLVELHPHARGIDLRPGPSDRDHDRPR